MMLQGKTFYISKNSLVKLIKVKNSMDVQKGNSSILTRWLKSRSFAIYKVLEVEKMKLTQIHLRCGTSLIYPKVVW